MRLLPVIICILLLFSSCTGRIPTPTSYPYSQQKKMQASHHWDVLAHDLANRINNELILSDNIDTAVFVKSTCGNESKPCDANETSSFNEAFRDLLITNLVGYGIPTHNQLKEDTIEIQYKVQIVRHSTNRVRPVQPGVFTAISAAIVVLRNAPAELLILAAGVLADVVNTNFTLNGHYEVIITTSMLSHDKYLFRASDIYYINDKDFYHYQDTMPQTKTIPLSTSVNKFQLPPVAAEKMAEPQTREITGVSDKKTDI